MPAGPTVEDLLARLRGGDRAAESEFLEAVYQDLRRIARRMMRAEREGHTLQPTALVNETYLRLFGTGRTQTWTTAREFFGSAVWVMRQVLVDAGRRRKAKRRDGVKEPLSEGTAAVSGGQEWVEIAVALERLRAEDERAAETAELRLYCGLNFREIGELEGVSTETARKEWLYAEAWLRRELGGRLS
ncbi:MAG: ECF-type sigma factor [Bryobacteraceae bacterium]|nr:ECF-type sigma factor [Bryobacteraceae bacterium]